MKTFAEAYPVKYVDNSCELLGTMFDWGINVLKMSPEQVMKEFVDSNFGALIEKGDLVTILGKSGRELLIDAYYLNHKTRLELYPKEYGRHYTEEYWAGWALAQYQRYSCQSFKTIQDNFGIDKIIRCYYPYHEAPIEKMYEIIDGCLERKNIKLFNKLDDQGNIINLVQTPSIANLIPPVANKKKINTEKKDYSR